MQVDGGICIFMCYQLYGCVCGVSQLSIFVRFEFDVVDYRIDWNVLEWQSVFYFNWCVDIGVYWIIDLYIFGSDNVVMFVIGIFQQCDVCRVVWIVFQVFDDCWNIIFGLFEVNNVVVFFVIIIGVMSGNVVSIVMIICFVFFFY